MTEEHKKEIMRFYRDQFLKDTDFTQLSDAPLSAQEKTDYTNYRQYLRDLPATMEAEQTPSYAVKTFEEWKA